MNVYARTPLVRIILKALILLVCVNGLLLPFDALPLIGKGEVTDAKGRRVTGKRALHVVNAPSPGATSSLAIGQEITLMAAKAMESR